MHFPVDLKYTESHLWMKKLGINIYVGITDYFQNSIGPIDLICLKSNSSFEKRESCGEIHSKKAKERILMPIAGTILFVNHSKFLTPHVFNTQPYSNWIIIIALQDVRGLKDLLSSREYEKYLKHLHKDGI